MISRSSQGVDGLRCAQLKDELNLTYQHFSHTFRSIYCNFHAVNMEKPKEGAEEMVIMPLGGGQEVGRSCILLQYQGRNILLDCGCHPGTFLLSNVQEYARFYTNERLAIFQVEKEVMDCRSLIRLILQKTSIWF